MRIALSIGAIRVAYLAYLATVDYCFVDYDTSNSLLPNLIGGSHATGEQAAISFDRQPPFSSLLVWDAAQAADIAVRGYRFEH